MDLKKLVFVFALLSTISFAQAAIVTDSITTDGAFWTVPDGVTLVNITLTGAGGSGNGGGYVYQVGSPTTYYLKYTGGGGLKGIQTTYNNIRVTPGESYQIHVGMPGASTSGSVFACPSTGSSTTIIPIISYTASNGNPSYVIINGVTYSSPGGYVSNITIQCTAGFNPSILSTTNYNSFGETGYIVSSLLAQSGANSAYGFGGVGGSGYGAGGGGGGTGGDYLSPVGGAGSGGVGAQGIVQFTYDSTTATPWYPSGYIKNASGTAIPSATVIITQLLNSVTLTTDVSGYYSTITGNLLSNVPVNITTSKTGYDSDINIFTPISTDSVINTTLLESSRTCTPQCIEGITRNAWDHSSIPSASVYLIENVTRVGYQTNTSTTSGYYKFSITASGTYDVWSSKDTYSNSSVVQVIV